MNAKHLLSSAAYRLLRPHVCCDCTLPGWLGKHYFDCNCFCECHDRYPYKRGEVVIKTWRGFSIVWTRRIVNPRDPTELMLVELRHGRTTLIEIRAFFDSIMLLVHRLRTKPNGTFSGNHFRMWRGRFPYPPTLRGRMRQWFDRRMDALLLNLLDRATLAANPPLSDADQMAMEADRLFYGGE